MIGYLGKYKGRLVVSAPRERGGFWVVNVEEERFDLLGVGGEEVEIVWCFPLAPEREWNEMVAARRGEDGARRFFLEFAYLKMRVAYENAYVDSPVFWLAMHRGMKIWVDCSPVCLNNSMRTCYGVLGEEFVLVGNNELKYVHPLPHPNFWTWRDAMNRNRNYWEARRWVVQDWLDFAARHGFVND